MIRSLVSVLLHVALLGQRSRVLCTDEGCPTTDPMAPPPVLLQLEKAIDRHASPPRELEEIPVSKELSVVAVASTKSAAAITSITCVDFSQWPDVDDNVTCGAGSCMALVKTRKNGGICKTYCESFGHTCLGAYEEKKETCEIRKEYGCGEAIPRTSDVLCRCSLGGGIKPSPTPTPTPDKLFCADFSQWPEVDKGVTCGAGSCMALVKTRENGGICKNYCESFGHTCLGAYEEKSNSCEIRKEYGCDETIPKTSDILCKCAGEGRGPPTWPPPTKAPSDTTKVDAACINLMLVADHGSRSSTQSRVAEGMATEAQRKAPVAIAGVGDNIYGRGAEGRPELIVRWFMDVYLKHESLRKPWYMVTGNHDWYTDARVERDFTTHPSNTGGHWRMPGFWYKHTFISKTSGIKVDLFFIDTQIWIGKSTVSEILGSEAAGEQKLWLQGALRDSTAEWKIVLGHHPVFSRGSHGVTSDMFYELDPMMRLYGVQAFVCGHDHSKHLIRYKGLNYIVNGAGGKSPRRPSDEYPRGSLVEDHQNPGFATLELCQDTPAHLTFFDADGNLQSTSSLQIERPAAQLSGSVQLSNGDSLRFPQVSGFSLVDTEWRVRCGNHIMRDVDRFCKSKEGSGCRVIADQPSEITCDHYCRNTNGLDCVNGWLEEDEDCKPTLKLGCHEGVDAVDAALMCECAPPRAAL